MKYDLQPNEVVLIKDEAAFHRKGASALLQPNGTPSELMLTNLSLIVMKKGLLGNAKGVQVFPVNQIKVHNSQAQARVGKTRSGQDVLEVYFIDGEEEFAFVSGGKRKIQTWIGKINEAVTGQASPEPAPSALPGADLVAGVLKDTLGAFKSRLGTKSNAPVSMATKCTSCGASVSGTRGQAVTCPYCLTAQQL